MSKHTLRLIFGGLALILTAVVYLNVQTKLDARHGCERGRLDRAAIANAYQATLDNFRETDQRVLVTARRVRGEHTLERTITGLQARARIDCKAEYQIVPGLHW